MNKEEIKIHLYNDTTTEAIKYINSLTDEESLYVYAYNYNWDNGFSIPYAILDNSNCTQSIALLLFELADGYTYLETKETDNQLPEWSKFIDSLYKDITNNRFLTGKVAYTPELTKVQLYKLKKVLSENETVFVSSIEGSNCNIYL